jgi:hypothetical protein
LGRFAASANNGGAIRDSRVAHKLSFMSAPH